MMEWNLNNAYSLAFIDREIGKPKVAAAEYEIERRVILATADFEYQSLLYFSEQALSLGAAALAARSTIVVDVPMLQVGILPNLQAKFANPIYCASETITRPQKGKTQADWGMQTLARRYPEAIFMIGQCTRALEGLVELIATGEIKPAFVIATPPELIATGDAVKQRLQDAKVPHITVKGCKGSVVVAAAIANGLLDLAWQAYGQNNGNV
ncbi:cobalt-precorrin-8 methylmutase [Microcystis aeruginosa NIES-4325]|uniref:Cobalt-precorrin-8 methylmutase n=2 Tax=Microcystis aeruginosa TaxID=1126 RepID=A0A5J4F7Q0_MICAE|nr:cobalt-precorrin-8 methylmutase [Microcystis aeruginosa NIES-4325]